MGSAVNIRTLRTNFLLLSGLAVFVATAASQVEQEETLGGPDSHEYFGPCSPCSDGSRRTRPPVRRVGRRTDTVGGTWCPFRFSIHQRFSLERRQQAKRRIRGLESYSGYG